MSSELFPPVSLKTLEGEVILRLTSRRFKAMLPHVNALAAAHRDGDAARMMDLADRIVYEALDVKPEEKPTYEDFTDTLLPGPSGHTVEAMNKLLDPMMAKKPTTDRPTQASRKRKSTGSTSQPPFEPTSE